MSIFSKIRAMFKGKGPSADLMKPGDARTLLQNSRVFVEASELVRAERERKEKAKEAFTFKDFVNLFLNSPRRIAAPETFSAAINEILKDDTVEIPGTHFVGSKEKTEEQLKAEYLKDSKNADAAVIRTPEFAAAAINGILININEVREFIVSKLEDYTKNPTVERIDELGNYFFDDFIPLLKERIEDAGKNRALETDLKKALVKANLGKYKNNPEKIETIDDAIRFTPEVVLSTAIHYLARERELESQENSVLDTVLSQCKAWNAGQKDLEKSFKQIQESYDMVLDYTETRKNLREKLQIVRERRNALALNADIAKFMRGEWDTKAISLVGDVASQRIQHYLNALARFASKKAMLTPAGLLHDRKNYEKYDVLESIDFTMDELMTELFDKDEGHHVLRGEADDEPIYLTDTQYHIMTEYYSKLAKDIKEGKSDLAKMRRGTNLTPLLKALEAEPNFDDIPFVAKKVLYEYMRAVSSLHAGELKKEPEFNYAVFYMDSMINDYICGYTDMDGTKVEGHLELVRKYLELQGYKNADAKILTPMIEKLTADIEKQNGIISENAALYRQAQGEMVNAREILVTNVGHTESEDGTEEKTPGKLTDIACHRSTMFEEDALALRDKIREVIEVPIPEILDTPDADNRTYFASAAEEGTPVTKLEPTGVDKIEDAVKTVKENSDKDLTASETLTDDLQEGKRVEEFADLVGKYHVSSRIYDLSYDAHTASLFFNALVSTLNQQLFNEHHTSAESE